MRHHGGIEVHDGMVHGIEPVLVLRHEGLVQAAERVQFEGRGDAAVRVLAHHRGLGGFQLGRGVRKISERHELVRLVFECNLQPFGRTCEVGDVPVKCFAGHAHGFATSPRGRQVLHVVCPEQSNRHGRGSREGHLAALRQRTMAWRAVPDPMDVRALGFHRVHDAIQAGILFAVHDCAALLHGQQVLSKLIDVVGLGREHVDVVPRNARHHGDVGRVP